VCASLIAAIALLAAPADPGAIADQAFQALRNAPGGPARSVLYLRLASATQPDRPLVALSALLAGAAGAERVPLATRAQVSGALEAQGETPVSPGRPLEQWRDEITRRALARLLTYSVSQGIAAAEELKLPKACLAGALADAARLEAAAPGGTGGGEAASLALDLISDIPDPSDELLRQVATAVLATDPRAADALCMRAGPARAVACEVCCSAATDAAAAVSAASGIIDPARRCRAVVQWLRTARQPGDQAAALAAARSAADAVQDPATQAALLSELVQVGPGGPDGASLLARAESVAATVPDSAEGAIALAGVAAAAMRVDEARARELLSQSLRLAKTVSGDGPKARALRGIGVAIGPSLPAEAMKIAGDLGASRSASRAEVLIAVTGTPDSAACAQAVNELLGVVDAWDTSPAEKLMALARSEAKVASAPGAGEDRNRGPAVAALRKRMGLLKAERAARLADSEERVLTLLDAARMLATLDRSGAAGALGAALADAARSGEQARVSQVLDVAASVGAALPLTIARGLSDPGSRAFALALAGDPDGAQAAVRKVTGAWPRAEAALVVAECAPSVEGARAAVTAVGSLAQGLERDVLALRCVDAALACDGEGRWEIAAEAGALASGQAGLARAQLRLAVAMARAGQAAEALDLVEQAAQLVEVAGGLAALVADLAVAREQVGQDGLALAASIGPPLERARALIAILVSARA